MAKRQPREPQDPTDPPVTISKDERLEWKLRRDALDLSTRDVEAACGRVVKNATITNIEGGHQRTLKFSKYVAVVRVLFRISKAEAEERAHKQMERDDETFRRIAAALDQFPRDEREHWARLLESRAKQLKK
jgi:hypothetical protein